MKPLLSVVLICFNLPREIPRTVRSLSTRMQQDIAEDDYEILLIDNGSTKPFDETLCRELAPNLRVIRIENASPSPVPAINRGLAEARGDVIGVLIDGARLASPGLLSKALAATTTHCRPVIGTIAFHLGPDVQNKSVANGYDQAAEDRLLADIEWPIDGYRLFDISVFASSSAQGWFTLPAESNAIFMKAAQWNELGGYDAGFTSAGGGLANLDLWRRACELPHSQVTLLLGEATFHQVHGGIATNSAQSRWPEFHAEYATLRGCDYLRPTAATQYFGSLDHITSKSLWHSVDCHGHRLKDQPVAHEKLASQGRDFTSSIPAHTLEAHPPRPRQTTTGNSPVKPPRWQPDLTQRASAKCGAVHHHLQPSDCIVVEDGIVAHFNSPAYQRYQNGPNRALHDFLLATPGAYRIDASLCDFYGHNATYNPNGYLVRI